MSGPPTRQVDLTLDKRFLIHEKTNLEFRAEIYNILNRANFQAPGAGIVRLVDANGTGTNQLQPGQAYTAASAGGDFGAATATVSNQIGLGTNRQFQLSLRINF